MYNSCIKLQYRKSKEISLNHPASGYYAVITGKCLSASVSTTFEAT